MKKLLSILLCTCLICADTITFGTTHQFMEQKAVMQKFSEIAHQYETQLFDYIPELGLVYGRSDVALDRFMDASIPGYQRWWKQEDQLLSALDALDQKDLHHTPYYTTYLLLKETLASNQASRICRTELWDVNPLDGWHNQLAFVATKQPVGTDAYRQAALKRWRTFAQVVDTQITNLKLGVRLGYTAPRPAVQRVITQINIILNLPIESSPFFDFVRRDPDPNFQKQGHDLVAHIIHPALKKYVNYLETYYLSVARTEIGVRALPAGQACYKAKIKQETTLSMTPEAIHALGLQEMRRIEQEVAEIGLKKYGIRDIKSVFQRGSDEGLHYFTTEQDIIHYNAKALAKAQASIPNWFIVIPKSPGIIMPYPSYRAQTGAPGQYYPPNDAGTEPGMFYINTYEPQQRSRIDQEATLFHELIPGHHFQIALQYENKALPHVNHYLFNSGFGEGWALYAERLADEMGLYDDEVSRLGMFSNEALRAARLVVDTGIHAMHWSREQAVHYLKQHTAMNDSIIEGEVDRYIMLPGQATAYMIGRNEILHLRHMAQQKLGKRFDIRHFHEQVLKNGMVSLPILKWQIEAWIQDQMTRSGQNHTLLTS